MLIFSTVCISSVGVALSRGQGKYFFRGNVSVEAGMSLQLCHLLPKYSEMHFTLTCLFERAYCISLTRLALLKRYWLVFFRAPWSGTARCRPGKWMVTLGLWEWAFMRYVGYPSVIITQWGLLCNSVALFGPQDLLQHRGAARAPSPDPDSSHQALHDGPQTTPQM